MLHGMARAVSGGAVYVSDKPGQHDFTLLRRLVLPDGHVLRAQLPGRPTRDCLFRDVLRDKRTMLKVGEGGGAGPAGRGVAGRTRCSVCTWLVSARVCMRWLHVCSLAVHLTAALS